VKSILCAVLEIVHLKQTIANQNEKLYINRVLFYHRKIWNKIICKL